MEEYLKWFVTLEPFYRILVGGAALVGVVALIYGLLGLDHFVLNHFPVQITITTDSEQDDFEDD